MASCMTLKRSLEPDRDPNNTNSTQYEPRTSTASSKRQRRCFPVTLVSSSSEPTTEVSFGNQSVFPDVQPMLTTDALLTRIKEEVRRLQRRHQLKSSSSDTNDDEHNANHHQSTESTSLSNLPGHSSSNNQHLLTLKQVNMICARLLKEREEKIREEYDQILSNKLNEQYEGFVRFTQDQLTRRFSELQFSYVS